MKKPSKERTMLALMLEKQKADGVPIRYDIATDKFKPVSQEDWDILHEIYMRLCKVDRDLVMAVSQAVRADKKYRITDLREKMS